MLLTLRLGRLFLTLKKQYTLYPLLDVSWNIFTSHSTSTLSAFEVFTVNMLYKLFTYLQVPVFPRACFESRTLYVLYMLWYVCRRDGVVKRTRYTLGSVRRLTRVLRQSDWVWCTRSTCCTGRVIWSSQHGSCTADSIVQWTGLYHHHHLATSITFLPVLLFIVTVLSIVYFPFMLLWCWWVPLLLCILL